MFSLMNIGITLLVILGFIMIISGVACMIDNNLFDRPKTISGWFSLISAWLIIVLLVGLIFFTLLAFVYYCITKPIQCNSINNDSEECLKGDSSNDK